MEIRFEDLTDQQCTDIIAHFVERKMTGKVKEIIIHNDNDDIIIKKEPRLEDTTANNDLIIPIV